MRKSGANSLDVESKITMIPTEENSCLRCWNEYSTDSTGDTAPRNHYYYISEKVYLTLPNKQLKILCYVARCPNCGNIKRDVYGNILIYRLNGTYGQRDYRNWELLKENHISIDRLERAIIDWPKRKTIVLDPSKGLRYDSSIEPREEETFLQYKRRYLWDCQKVDKWI